MISLPRHPNDFEIRHERWIVTQSDPSLRGRIRLFVEQVATTALDLIFPLHCVHCERVGSLLCAHCRAAVISAPAPLSLAGFDDVRVRAVFEGAIRSAIHALKYDRQTRLGVPLGMLLCEALADAHWPVDIVMPVPLHASRQRERGYNQAALLAQVVAHGYGWEFEAAALARVRQTASQVELNAHERQVNVAGAFAAEPAVVQGRNILVIDDVLTTGATLVACAGALRDAGAAAVYAATLAGARHAA